MLNFIFSGNHKLSIPLFTIALLMEDVKVAKVSNIIPLNLWGFCCRAIIVTFILCVIDIIVDLAKNKEFEIRSQEKLKNAERTKKAVNMIGKDLYLQYLAIILTIVLLSLGVYGVLEFVSVGMAFSPPMPKCPINIYWSMAILSYVETTSKWINQRERDYKNAKELWKEELEYRKEKGNKKYNEEKY